MLAGIDVSMLGDIAGSMDAGCPGHARHALKKKILEMQDAFTALERCRWPVVAAIQGVCIGSLFGTAHTVYRFHHSSAKRIAKLGQTGRLIWKLCDSGAGINLAAACDIRVCTVDATFCVKEIDLGITADIGILQRLGPIVGHGRHLVQQMLLPSQWQSVAGFP
eukprot:scaffold14881_cov30-Prasinocladus_malaysianus.AAC.1